MTITNISYRKPGISSTPASFAKIKYTIFFVIIFVNKILNCKFLLTFWQLKRDMLIIRKRHELLNIKLNLVVYWQVDKDAGSEANAGVKAGLY